jgi:hypothetical protein
MPISKVVTDPRILRLVIAVLCFVPGFILGNLGAVLFFGLPALAYFGMVRSARSSLVAGIVMLGMRGWLLWYLFSSASSTAGLMIYMVLIVDLIVIIVGAAVGSDSRSEPDNSPKTWYQQ